MTPFTEIKSVESFEENYASNLNERRGNIKYNIENPEEGRNLKI